MDWIARHLPRTKEEARRDEETADVLRSINAFMQELRFPLESVRVDADEPR